jgi:predicted dehydrogenase
VIGCGEVAQIMHLPFLSELRDLFAVQAVCDISPRLVETVGDIFPVPNRNTRPHYGWPLAGADAVASLTADHAPAAIAAAEAGKHIFVEKPMCFTPDEGRAMIAAAERAGVTLMVGYMKRYDPGYEFAQGLFRQMEGTHLIRVHDTVGRGPLAPQEIYTLHRADDLPSELRSRGQAEARERMARAVGGDDPAIVGAYSLLLGLASHDMAVLRGAFGDPVAVRHAQVVAGGSLILAMLEFPGDLHCMWEIGNIPRAAHTWFNESLTAYGPTRTVSVEFPNPYVRYAPTLVRVHEMDGSARSERTVTASYDEAFRREWRHFHHCATTGERPRTPGADGLRDVEILAAIARSAASGRPITLDKA